MHYFIIHYYRYHLLWSTSIKFVKKNPPLGLAHVKVNYISLYGYFSDCLTIMGIKLTCSFVVTSGVPGYWLRLGAQSLPWRGFHLH